MPVNNFVITIDLSQNGKKACLFFQYNKDVINIVKKIPNYKYNNKSWEFVLSNENKILDIINTLIQNKCTIKLTNAINQLYKNAIIKYEKRKLKTEDIQKIKDLEDYDLDLSKFININLFPFQKVTYRFIEYTNGKCIVSLQQGLGKTLCSLAYCKSKGLKTLVVCPASLKLNWRDEINKFIINSSYQVLHSGEEIDLKDMKDFTIINYDLLTNRKTIKSQTTVISLLNCIKKNKFDCVILDESQRIKNDTTSWTKFIHRNLKDIENRILLSGTPIKSKPIEFFSQLKFIDKKRWNSKTDYGYRYADPQFNGFGITYNGASNLEELYFETAPYIIRKEKKDVLKDLPDKLYTKIPIELSKQELKEYINLEGIIIKEVLFSGKNKTSIGDISKLNDIKQFTSNIKTEPAKDIINSIIDTGKKIVVFCGYNNPLKNLHEYYKDKSVIFIGSMNEKQKNEAYRKFVDNDECKIFFGGTIAAGVGLNLQVCDTVLHLDQPWTPADYEQATDRCFRIGTVNNVSVMTLVCEHTIDEYIFQLIEEKQKIIEKVLNNKEYESTHETSVVDDILKIYREKYEK